MADELRVEFAAVEGEENVEVDACNSIVISPLDASGRAVLWAGITDGRMFLVVCPFAQSPSLDSCATDPM